MSKNDDNKEPKKKMNRAKVLKELENIAKKAGIAREIDWARPISKTDIDYILEHWPFLEIENPTPEEDEEREEVDFFTAMSGWLIHDYPNMIASSPGIFLFGGGYYYVDWGDENEGSDAAEWVNRGIVNPKKGTIINQMFLTGVDMVNLALYHKWKDIRIVGGHPRMKWAAWVHAKKNNMSVLGYQPTEKEIKKAKRLAKSREEMDRLLRVKKGNKLGSEPNR
jgi:hypothetical protein